MIHRNAEAEGVRVAAVEEPTPSSSKDSAAVEVRLIYLNLVFDPFNLHCLFLFSIDSRHRRANDDEE